MSLSKTFCTVSTSPFCTLLNTCLNIESVSTFGYCFPPPSLKVHFCGCRCRLELEWRLDNKRCRVSHLRQVQVRWIFVKEACLNYTSRSEAGIRLPEVFSIFLITILMQKTFFLQKNITLTNSSSFEMHGSAFDKSDKYCVVESCTPQRITWKLPKWF